MSSQGEPFILTALEAIVAECPELVSNRVAAKKKTFSELVSLEESMQPDLKTQKKSASYCAVAS